MERITVKIAPNREIRVSRSLAVVRGRAGGDANPSPNIQSRDEIEASNPGGADLPTLDISSEFQRDTPRFKNGWGQLPKESRFGIEQKRAMLRAGAVCDRQYGLKQIVLTGTLPGSINEANRALASWSGYAMNRVMQWVRRIVGENWTFGVWEYQARGALHYHLAVCYQSEDQAVSLENGFKAQWIKVLRSISERAKIDVFRKADGSSWSEREDVVQADSRRLRKSCAAYFSKYASKGYGKMVGAEMRKNGLVRYCPSRWIVLSRPVSRAIKEQSFAYSVDGPRRKIEELVEHWLHELEQLDCLRFAYRHKVIRGETYVFYCNDEEFEIAQKMIHEAFKSKAGEHYEEIRTQAQRQLSTLPRAVPAVLWRSTHQLPKRSDRLVYRWSANPYWSKGILVPLATSISYQQLDLISPHYLGFQNMRKTVA